MTKPKHGKCWTCQRWKSEYRRGYFNPFWSWQQWHGWCGWRKKGVLRMALETCKHYKRKKR